MVRVKAAKVSARSADRRELYATVCWYYPQYTLTQASRMPARDVKLLIRVAHKREAVKFYNLAQIAAAARSTKGAGMKKLIDHFKKAVES